MKSNAIVRIIIWSIVLVVLIGILAAFVADEMYLNDYSPEIHLATSLEPYPVQSESAIPPEKMYTFPAGDITELEIEWAAGSIFIDTADVAEITVRESDVKDAKYAMLLQQRNGKLTIQYCQEHNISFGINKAALSKDLYIQVPRDWECRSLEIDAASAELAVGGMAIGEMDFDGASGTCNFVNCSVIDMDIDTASGDVQFTGSLKALDFDAASASFIGEFENTPDRIDMDSMSGNLDISLPEDCGFALNMNGMSSSFHSDFPVTENQNGMHIYGDGSCRINVDGMSSDVTIRCRNAN